MIVLDFEALQEHLHTEAEALRSEVSRMDPEDSSVGRLEGGVAVLERLLLGLHGFEVTQPPRKIPAGDRDVREIVRRNDPDTSWEAAMSVTSGKRRKLFQAIVLVLTHFGPSTDDEVHHILETKGFAHSLSGLRTRRSELKAANWVRDSGARRQSDQGKPSTVWELVPDACF